jgi:hypothetical protein
VTHDIVKTLQVALLGEALRTGLVDRPVASCTRHRPDRAKPVNEKIHQPVSGPLKHPDQTLNETKIDMTINGPREIADQHPKISRKRTYHAFSNSKRTPSLLAQPNYVGTSAD